MNIGAGFPTDGSLAVAEALLIGLFIMRGWLVTRREHENVREANKELTKTLKDDLATITAQQKTISALVEHLGPSREAAQIVAKTFGSVQGDTGEQQP